MRLGWDIECEVRTARSAPTRKPVRR